MIRNYIKIAWRNISKQKFYSLINIIGLAVGFACIMLILAFVKGELSYDEFHQKKEQVFRVVNNHTDEDSGELTRAAYTYAPIAGLVMGNIAGVNRTLRIHEKQGLLWRDGDEKFIEKQFLYADSTFFEMFDFPLIQGDPNSVLKTPFSLVISQSIAKKYFGNTNPLGQKLSNQDDSGINQLTITGVMRDLPANTHLQADMICSMTTLQKTQPWNFSWYYPPMYTYLEFINQPDVSVAEKQITAFVQGKTPQGYGQVDYRLQALNDIYLHSKREGEFRPTGDYRLVIAFVAIAIFILVLASVNFVNLSTARSIKKAKEVGIRKAMGAYRKQLITQFTSESVLTTFISFFLSLGLLFVLTDLFESIIGKNVSFTSFFDINNALIISASLLIIGVLAGLYPAFYLSAIAPTGVSGSNQLIHSGKAKLRKSLVVFQFATSSLLIFGTLAIYQQMNYLQNKDLGFNQDRILVIPLEETKDQNNYELLKQQLLSLSSVASVTMTSGISGSDGFYAFNYNIGTDPEGVGIPTLGTDEDFNKTYNIRIKDGRDFSRDIVSDKENAFLINQATADRFGWENPIGQKLTLNYYIDRAIAKEGQVIGLVEDFHFESLYHEMQPLVMHILPPSYYAQYLSVKLNPTSIQTSIKDITGLWEGFNPSRPFEYFFLDDKLQKQYQSEVQLSKMLSWFSGLAIFVSILGLVGLITFTTEQRTKEIGIRKVLGAGVKNILYMISKEYLALIILANAFAFPVAWFYFNDWLNDFAYRTELSWVIFGGAIIGLLLLSIISVSLIASKAARINPVESLRHE